MEGTWTPKEQQNKRYETSVITVMNTTAVYQQLTFCPFTKENCRVDCKLMMPTGYCAIYRIANQLEEM